MEEKKIGIVTVLYNSEKTNLILYTFTEEKEYKIPDGVTDIFAGAFGCSYNLNVVTIPESVIRIGSNALNGSFESIEKSIVASDL